MERKSPDGLAPDEARQMITARLEEADLPCFEWSRYWFESDMLDVGWGTMYFSFDLEREKEIEPFDDLDREAILGTGMGCGCPPIDITVPASAADPRDDVKIPGVNVRHVPDLHPDDTDVVDGIPCTSVSRTLIDLAEVMDREELRECFARARDLGQLDAEALYASRARVEWRPSLEMLDEVIEEFCAPDA